MKKTYLFVGLITAFSLFLCYGIGGIQGVAIGGFIAILVDFKFIESMKEHDKEKTDGTK